MMTKTFYAIYDADKKKFKGRGNASGVRWSEFPTQTYDTEARANGALKSHLKRTSLRSHFWRTPKLPQNIIVIPVKVVWDEQAGNTVV